MIYSLTDKLSFDTNPVIEVKGEHFEVNADAETLLKMMSVMQEKDELEAAGEAYKLLFSEAARKRIAEMKLQAKDWFILIETAMALVQGEEPEESPRQKETGPSVL